MSSLPQTPGARRPVSRKVTLILGGARSGKSSHAERLAAQHERVLYLATATAGDEEMRAKITRHQADRPPHWQTAEEPLELPSVIAAQGPLFDVILVDCLTFYASNLLLQHEHTPTEIEPYLAALVTTLSNPPCPILLVSNEVGSGVVPEYALGRRYRDLLGELNQRVAAIASDVVLMVAGLPLVLKPPALMP